MKLQKLFLTAASLILSSMLISGCSTNEIITTTQQERTEISFSWWGNDARHDYTIQAIKKFEEIHPEIKVKCHYAEWSGYQTRNRVQMVSGTESDVMQINYSWLSQYSADGNGYYDLSQLNNIIDFSQYSAEDLEYGIQNEKLNAIPIALNTETIYINKTIFESYGLDIPSSWDDFFKAGDVMKGEHYPIAMSQKPAFFLIVSYTGYLTGKDFMDEKGKILYNKNDIKKMIEFYCELINHNVMPQVEYFDKLNIASGVYAGCMAWVSDATSYCSPAMNNGYEMVVADYPSVNGKLENWYAKPATMYAVSSSTEHPEESAILLNYLINSKEMAEFQKIEKGIPLSNAARTYLTETDQLNGIQYEAFTKLSEFKDQLKAISPYFENDELTKTFFNACTEVYFEKSTIDEQVDILYEFFRSYKN